jgi:hypothetical protein
METVSNFGLIVPHMAAFGDYTFDMDHRTGVAKLRQIHDADFGRPKSQTYCFQQREKLVE